MWSTTLRVGEGRSRSTRDSTRPGLCHHCHDRHHHCCCDDRTIYRSIFAGDYILGVSAKLLAQIGNPDVVIAMSQVRRTMSQVMRTRITFIKKVWIGWRGRYDWCVFKLKVSTCECKSIHKSDSLVHWEFHCWNTSFLQIIINDGDGDGGNAMIAITDICPDSCWPCEWGVSADGQ